MFYFLTPRKLPCWEPWLTGNVSWYFCSRSIWDTVNLDIFVKIDFFNFMRTSTIFAFTLMYSVLRKKLCTHTCTYSNSNLYLLKLILVFTQELNLQYSVLMIIHVYQILKGLFDICVATVSLILEKFDIFVKHCIFVKNCIV